ncbi:hypothetical protein PHMEG_00032091 [Phytophthora megakarya]|uniref:Carboxypeptidase n=1 Tax=Phytophthora megakarya TaxID=4795 RepID=A0A225UWS5_9STRA|nr:hypothetical protein PHMEG_00032091 [Phytophthora megakarya]
MAPVNEKTQLLPAEQTISSSANNKLKVKICLGILTVVTTVSLAEMGVRWWFFDEPATTTNGFICGDTKNEAGYIELVNKVDDHYFYWFFESRTSPDTDPLVLWLTGGPDLTTKTNPYSWNNNANVIWLDQPTGVGFSFGAPADKDYNETNVGENIYWFLQGFIKKYPEYRGREFFVTGESYGGHYVPAAAHYIWKANKAENSSNETATINLKGLAIGNGLTNELVQYAHNQEMNRNRYNITLLTDAQVEQMKIDSVE